MEQNQPEQVSVPIERQGGAPMMWYIWAIALVTITVVALCISGGAPGRPAP